MGSGHPGELQPLKLTIHNRSGSPVTLIGAEHGCRCQASGSLPIDIPPEDQVEIDIRVRLGQTAGVQYDRFWLLTSHQRQGMLICRWRANVVERHENNDAEHVAGDANNDSNSKMDGDLTCGSSHDKFPVTSNSRSVVDRENMYLDLTSVGDRNLRSRLLLGKPIFNKGVF